MGPRSQEPEVVGQGFSPARHQRQRETVVEPPIAALLPLIDLYHAGQIQLLKRLRRRDGD